jgi:hypothetical protein
MYYLKRKPKITYDSKHTTEEAGPVPTAFNLPHHAVIRVILVARPLLTTVARKLCRCERGIFKSRTCVHSRTIIHIEIVCSSSRFTDVFSDREAPNKAATHRQNIWMQEVFGTGNVSIVGQRRQLRSLATSKMQHTAFVCLVVLR